MENASDGCVENLDNGTILSELSADDSKLRHVSPFVNKPIFRRKLIEKYSTARYNINTKRVLVRKSTANQTTLNDKASKVARRSASLRTKNDENPKNDENLENEENLKNNETPENDLVNSPSLSKDDSTSVMPPADGLAYEEGLSKNLESNVQVESVTTSGPTSKDETPDSKSVSPSSISCELPSIASNKQQDSQLTRKRKFSSASSSSTGSKATWKIASKKIYNQLWDLCQSTVEIKTEEPKKETKKRKICQWTKKRSRRKPVAAQKKVADKTYFDPYVECLKETETQSESTSSNQSSEKLGIVMYLGVERPLFPLVYRNLRVLNDSNDAMITDFWSEFALSTLVTKIEDRKSKPILVPVKDPELISLVSEYVEEPVTPTVLNVSSDKSASDDDAVKTEIIPPACVKQEENDVPEKKKRKYKPRSVNKTPRTYGTRGKYKKRVKKEPEKIPKTEPAIPIRIRTPSPAPTPPTLTPSTTPIPALIPAHAPTLIPASTLAPGPTPSPSNKPRNRAIRSKGRFDEKSILKKFGYKECFVAIPKLSDTLIKYLSAGNYSNESAQLSDPTERELIEETDDFGLIQCTRTDGIIIDYVKRNRSLVYFYKLKKMLDFQKTNNKYFVCCDYMLIDRSDEGDGNGDGDGNVDVTSIQEDDDENYRIAPAASGPRNSKNPNDLFKSSKISEWKNKSNKISWVKNHDLKSVSDVKWLLISLDKHIASLSHASGCVLRYRLLFEIIYRAELSKKVICCEISNDNGNDIAGDKLAFGVYAFPGLCDKVLAGPYSYHEEHQLSASIRTSNGDSEYAHIRTLEEKENFPQMDDSTPVKHINAKWWSGTKTNDLTEQYLNFFFNPSFVKCVQPTDKFCLSKIIADHPCHNYHSYEITGRESNLVLFHDRTNTIEKTIVTPTEPAAVVETNAKSHQAEKLAATEVPPKQSRNLRKKPRRNYARLLTDDMAVPAKTKNLEFHIVNVKSLRKRSLNNEAQSKSKRSRYHDSPQMHIMNERMRRLEFRNRRNNLASVLEARPSGSNNAPSLVTILTQTNEIIAYLEQDNNKLDEEGKRLRVEQAVMMRKFLSLLRSLDINSTAYKRGMLFVAAWKQIKSEHRNKLIDILGQNFDKNKGNKTTELSRNSHANIKGPICIQRPIIHRPVLRPVLLSKKSMLEKGVDEDEYEFKDDDPEPCRVGHAEQRLKSRKRKRQRMRNELRKRNQFAEKRMPESFDCEISEEVVCEDGKLSNPLGSDYILDGVGEVPIIISNVRPNIDPYAVDPLANNSDDYSSPPGGYSSSKNREPSHPLYIEHSYCNINDEPPVYSSNMFDRRMPQIRNVQSIRTVSPASMIANRCIPVRPNLNSYRSQLSTVMTRPNGYRPNRPILNHSTVSSLQRRNSIRTRAPVVTAAALAASPAFQIRVNKAAEENLGIDILDNGRMFARLNIAKLNNGNDTNSAPSSSCGAAGGSTSNKIMTIIQRFLLQMEKASPSVETNDDERAKQAKRKHVVNSLKSFISKFESRRKPPEDTGYSSSRASNSDDTSPPYVTDSIELESGYSSKSEESCDRDNDFSTNEVSLRNRFVESQSIENIVLDDDDDDDEDRSSPPENEQERQQEVDDDEIQEVEEEQVLQEDEFIALEEEEEEEIVGEEELIEEEEEEEIVGDGTTLEEMNDVDAAMRDNENDRFADFDDSDENAAPLANRTENDECTSVAQYLENYRPNCESERFSLPKSMSKVLYTTNQFTIIKSKDKFVPNIMKTPTKTVVNATSSSSLDHLARIRIKPSVGSLVKLSTDNLQLTMNSTRQVVPLSNNNDSIIKRLWYSPVTKADQTEKILRRESSLNEPVRIGSPHSGKSVEDKSECDGEQDDSNDKTEPGTDKDNGGANRILIKSFANHDKFQEAFLSNVDKLLNPES